MAAEAPTIVAAPPSTPTPAQPGPTAVPAAPVTAPTAPTTPPTPAKPGSGRARLREALQQTADKSDPDLKGTPAPPAADPAKAPDPGKQPDPAVKTPDSKVSDPNAPTAPPADDKGKDGKKNPWHLVDSYKKRVTAAETELLEVKKLVTPEKLAEIKELQTKSEAREARLKELEEEIRYVDYTKSEEFKTKYHQPYVQAWERAMKDLGELTVDNGDGTQRNFSTQDMLRLVNLPLKDAKQLATAMDPDFASELMQHRGEIKRLFDDQAEQLKKVKAEGGTRDKERQEQMTRLRTEIGESITKQWTADNESLAKSEKYGRYFSKVEGDEEGNAKLEKGFALADAAFTESPLNPALTPEQRAAVVKKHVAIRNRAAAFGRLVYQLEKAEAKIAEQAKQLEGFKASVPPDGGGSGRQAPTNGAPTQGKARDRVLAELEKLARPA